MQFVTNIAPYDVKEVRNVINNYNSKSELDGRQSEILSVFRRETKPLTQTRIEHSSVETELLQLRVRVKQILKGTQSLSTVMAPSQAKIHEVSSNIKRHSKRTLATVVIDSRFFSQAVRELAVRKNNGLWLYDEDIRRNYDTFSVEIDGDKAVFSNYDEKDKEFSEILEKYTHTIPAEFERYIAPNSAKSTADKSHLKTSHSFSSPLLKSLRSSSNDLRCDEYKVKKLSTPIMHHDEFVISQLLKEHSRFNIDPGTFEKLVVLHTLFDETVYQFFQTDQSELANKLRNNCSSMPAENELLDLAKTIHKSKKVGLFTKRLKKDLVVNNESFIESIAPDIRLKVINYVVSISSKDLDFISKFFRSFGNQMGVEACAFFKEVLQQENVYVQAFANNRGFGNAVMDVLHACFVVPGYYPKDDKISVWYNLFMKHLDTYKSIPKFFCNGSSCITFSSLIGKEGIDKIVETISRYGLSGKLCKIVYNRLALEQDAGLAQKLLRDKSYSSIASMAQTYDQAKYFYSLLMIKTKAVDFALLALPEFVQFIQEQRASSVGCLLYDQLIERVRRAFFYENLPEEYSDQRQTQCGPQLLAQNRKRINDQSVFQFLSQTEVVKIFMTLQPISRLKLGEAWIDTYKKNLSLILKQFLPHLHQHLGELSVAYRAYRDCTIGITASVDNDRYDPKRHELELFPKCVVQYIKSDQEEFELFQKNLQALGGFYQKLLNCSTVCMKNDEMLAYISIERVAKKIVESFPGSEVSIETITKILSNSITKGLATKQTENLYGKETVTNVCENGQSLWFMSYHMVTFEETIKQMKSTKNVLTFEILKELAGLFCQKVNA
ncbi:MAG: hypothetical protein LLF94_02820 [Chlamydiales bacterium]|nr:hypothetical protein [Chlamydiales bacterium]